MTLSNRPTFISCLLRLVLVSFLVINASLQSLGSHARTSESPFKKGDKIALTSRVLKGHIYEHKDIFAFDGDIVYVNLNLNVFFYNIDSLFSDSIDNASTVYSYALNARAPPARIRLN